MWRSSSCFLPMHRPITRCGYNPEALFSGIRNLRSAAFSVYPPPLFVPVAQVLSSTPVRRLAPPQFIMLERLRAREMTRCAMDMLLCHPTS